MTLEPGREIARYRLVDKLGQGGMGVVWRARDLRLDRDVALKTLAPHLVGDASRRERFIREAKAAAAVSHPNLAAIHDVGEAAGVVYLAMELVEGRTLRELASGGPLTLPRILSIGAQIAEGLARAHREGIVHRDIKPDNVMVDETGHAKVLDFGLAKLRGAREEERAEERAEQETLEALTKEGQTVGTVPYMSPEQARGKATDGRSDLFSLGTVLYELATGRLPFRGETSMDTMTAILTEDPAPPASLNPRVGERLAELLDKCLQKDPGRRYQSAGDLAIDLRRLAESPTSSYRQAAGSGAADSRPPASRRKILWAAAGVAVLAALALAAALWLGRRAEPPGEGMQAAAGEAGVPPPIRSLAVIPLDDHSPGEKERYFADGMTEALIAEIAQISDLRVISRTSVMPYRESRPPLRQIAGELGVDAVVEGSILRADGRIRIIAQLIDARDDRHVWAGTYERDHERVLALQREVALAVAEEIEGALRPGGAQERAGAREVSPEAHDLYLRGRHNILFGTEEALERGLVQFRSALEIDPGFARAWVGIAEAYMAMANNIVAPREAMPEAKRAVLRALALDPGLADAYSTLSGIQALFEWNPEASARSIKRALEINPSHPEGLLGLAFQEIQGGDRERGVELIRKALKLDPLNAGLTAAAAWAYILGRDYEASLETARELERRYPTVADPRMTQSVALTLLGRHEEAVAAARQGVEMDASVHNLAFLAWVEALAGQEAAARETLVRMEGAPADFYTCPYERALGWAALEEHGRAEELFELALEDRAICWAGGGLDPRTDELREHSWFQDLLSRRTPMGPDDPDYVPIPPGLGLGAGS